ncbi:hypothetical protein F5Y14DRAFT_296528 [Nemania sp. NC0429]|nr:hypothetical protein F5Y14DRAFT_296528 [Nemania sp. NC0429]
MSAITLRQIREDPARGGLFGLLNEYIQPGSTTPASRAALSFAQGLVGGEGVHVDEAFLWRFWDDVFDVAAQIPHDHPAQDRLAAFARELALVPETGDVVWESRVWTDLPLLGAAIREHLDSAAFSTTSKSTSTNHSARVSFHAFVARLLHAGVSPGSETTAIWMLRDALEEEKEKEKGKDEGSNDTADDEDLMTAAVYIEYAGATFVQALALQPEPRLDEGQRRSLRGGRLWEKEWDKEVKEEGEEGEKVGGEKSGLTARRWAFWGQRFRERAGDEATAHEAKDLALHAARLIEVWAQTRLAA